MRVFWAISILFVVISLTQPGPLQLIPGVDNPFGFGPDLRGGRPIAPILGVATFIIFASLGSSMISRYRSAGRVERQQMKWFFLALGLSAIALGLATLESVFMDGPASGNSLTVYVFAGAVVPVAIGIAILRYRLYDIDRLISRTIAYGAITGILGAVFVGTILALQGLLTPYTGEQTIAVAVSTLAVFALFQPLRRRVQATVDRRFDRARYDADQTVRTFASRLRGDMDLGTVSTEIVKTASATVRPASASVWLRGSGR
jgi:hypothetical protein